jgi:hypothetical protein
MSRYDWHVAVTRDAIGDRDGHGDVTRRLVGVAIDRFSVVSGEGSKLGSMGQILPLPRSQLTRAHWQLRGGYEKACATFETGKLAVIIAGKRSQWPGL